jgi:drug/metabolite transporter (DMT)-like permease
MWRWPNLRSGLALIGAGLGGGGAQLAMTRAYSLQRAAPVTAVSSLGVVFTYLLAIPLFGDLPGAWQMAGAALVLAATALLTAGGR